jgi:hypothetical protein
LHNSVVFGTVLLAPAREGLLFPSIRLERALSQGGEEGEGVVKGRRTMIPCLVLVVTVWAQAQTRNWQTGTLLETEQQKILEGSTTNKAINGNAKNGNYSQDSTTTKTDNYDTYQVFTIGSGQKVYVARERLFFPWSKPALSTVGEPVKFAVEKNNLYIMDAEGKQHKLGIVKVSLKETPTQ